MNPDSHAARARRDAAFIASITAPKASDAEAADAAACAARIAARDNPTKKDAVMARYVFTYGPSPSYRTRESEHETLHHARDAARIRRCQGWSTSRITKKES